MRDRRREEEEEEKNRIITNVDPLCVYVRLLIQCGIESTQCVECFDLMKLSRYTMKRDSEEPSA